VEAGLRTGDKRSPFPEEVNRRLISVIADLHFAPTEAARDHLLSENTPIDRILVTGNTGIDSVLRVLARVKRGEIGEPVVPGRRPGHRLVLITGHRRESFGEGLRSMCLALSDLAHEFPDVDFVYPAHLNPSVQAQVTETLGAATHPNFHVTAPMHYEGFVVMMSRAALIITDSGGIQEEALSLRTPVLVTRTTTERPEGLAGGLVQLVGVERDAIRRAAGAALRSPTPEWSGPNPYGDGQAASRIVERLERELTGQPMQRHE
jgi:UDP-N-acetylglucosamine 2-epimerase (non-hydrolysing)